MSKVGPEGRSFLPIEAGDLQLLGNIAHNDLEMFFQSHPAWRAAYGDRVLGVALCQGAAKHFLDRKTGINDFDVYTFFENNPSKRWYAKRIKSYDLGNDKFGKSVDKPGFKGRRVDCMGRAIHLNAGEDLVSGLQRYLGEDPSETARLLSEKAVVLIRPVCGTVIWPISKASHD